MKNIVLQKNYSIKGDESHKFLFNIETGKKYNLSKKQFELLILCNGSMTRIDLAKKSGIHFKDFNMFLNKLKNIRAIEYSDKSERKKFVYITKGKQLKEIQWEITNLCNLNCLHCYQAKYLRKERDLDLKKCESIIKDMAALGVEKISLSGGEPLIRKDLFDILMLLQKEDIKVQAIFTNGILISDNFLKKIKGLRSRPRFNISLDGMRFESLKIRGLKTEKATRAYISKVFENISLLKKNDFQIRINTILNKMNYSEMEEMYDKLSSIGDLSWSIGFPREMGSCAINKDAISANSRYLLDACKKLIKIHLKKIKSGKNTIDLKIQNLFHEKFLSSLAYYSAESYICNYENKESAACLKPNGDVLPCSVLFDYVMGNIQKERLYNIWNSKEMRKFKETKISDLEKCVKCKFMKLCGGGCRATASILKNDIKANDPIACEFMHYFFKEIKPLLK